MKLSSAVLLIAIMGGAGWYGYTRWYPKFFPTAAAPLPPAFPVERVLTDQTGRTVPARLLARDAADVRFIRTSDGAIYHYPISSLSEQDQQFVRQYPVSRLEPAPTGPNSSFSGQTAAPSQSPAEVHLRRERAALEHKIALLNLELQKHNSKSPRLSRDQILQQIHDSRNRVIDIDRQLMEIAYRARQR